MKETNDDFLRFFDTIFGKSSENTSQSNSSFLKTPEHKGIKFSSISLDELPLFLEAIKNVKTQVPTSSISAKYDGIKKEFEVFGDLRDMYWLGYYVCKEKIQHD